MSEGPPKWKITPPLDPPGPAYHVWREGDQVWGEAHADWDAEPFPLPDMTQNDAIAAAARAALPALEQVISLWPYPVVDIKAVDQLVRVLHEADANTQPEA